VISYGKNSIKFLWPFIPLRHNGQSITRSGRRFAVCQNIDFTRRLNALINGGAPSKKEGLPGWLIGMKKSRLRYKYAVPIKSRT
jgi:hypothetical protein